MAFPADVIEDPVWGRYEARLPRKRNGYRAEGKDGSGRWISVTGDTPLEASCPS